MTLHPPRGEYVNQTLRLPDLTVTHDMIENVRFVNCSIIGPAIAVIVDGVTITHCNFDAPLDALIWPITKEREYVVGAIGLNNVEFYGCVFQRVGFGVREDRLEIFRAGFATD